MRALSGQARDVVGGYVLVWQWVQGRSRSALCTSLVLMATFSPSPAPRRSSRLQTRGNSPTRSQRSLRLAQTSTLNQLVDGTNSVASGMDLDDRASIFTDKSLSRMGSDILFAKTDEMSVSFYANLPLEVKQVLRTSGAVHISDNIWLTSPPPLQTSIRTHTLGKLIQ